MQGYVQCSVVRTCSDSDEQIRRHRHLEGKVKNTKTAIKNTKDKNSNIAHKHVYAHSPHTDLKSLFCVASVRQLRDGLGVVEKCEYRMLLKVVK